VKQEQDIGNKRKDREIEKWMGREAERHGDRGTDRQRDRRMKRWRGS
jgi:hypothetical protein